MDFLAGLLIGAFVVGWVIWNRSDKPEKEPSPPVIPDRETLRKIAEGPETR
jgi:hypothetical protein